MSSRARVDYDSLGRGAIQRLPQELRLVNGRLQTLPLGRRNLLEHTMLLRPYRATDFETLLQIDQECFPPGISYSRYELESFLGHRLSRAWVAEDGNAAAGFIIAMREPQRVGHIITIDVLASARRRGVGSLMMDAAESWAKEARLKLMYLETADDNDVAQRFYSVRDYLKVERIENYYANGAAAWVMAKRLYGKKNAPRQNP
jgi:[ribosomal protein S18]-alanine N-acetyltransferase